MLEVHADPQCWVTSGIRELLRTGKSALRPGRVSIGMRPLLTRPQISVRYALNECAIDIDPRIHSLGPVLAAVAARLSPASPGMAAVDPVPVARHCGGSHAGLYPGAVVPAGPAPGRAPILRTRLTRG